jgi:hypothetical protein
LPRIQAEDDVDERVHCRVGRVVGPWDGRTVGIDVVGVNVG